MAQNPPAPNNLRGTPPAMYDGDRKKSEEFKRDFNLYAVMNDQHELITSPYKKVVLALSFMRGPNINDWKADQLKLLIEKTTRAVNPIPNADPVLWTEFETAFDTAFTNTTEKQTAHSDLLKLKMDRSDLDSYIARFMHLALKAGFGINDYATAHLFYRGLRPNLVQAILKRDTTPVTVNDWIDAAKAEQKKYTQASVIWNDFQAGATHFSAPPMWTNRQQRSNQPRRHPNDETVPMDLSVARRAVTTEDKKRHREQNLCYICSKKGHMARNCPNRKDNDNKKNPQFKSKFKRPNNFKFQPQPWRNSQTPRAARARIASIEEVDEEDDDPYTTPKDIDIDDIAAQTASFTEEQKVEWVEAMKKHNVDFQQT